MDRLFVTTTTGGSDAESTPALTCETAKADYLFATEPFVLEYNAYGAQCVDGALPDTEECLDLAEDAYDYISSYYDVVSDFSNLGMDFDLSAATALCEDDTDPDCAANEAYNLLSEASDLCGAAFDDDCITARDGVWFTWTLACNAFDVYRSTCAAEGTSVKVSDFCDEYDSGISSTTTSLFDNCEQAVDQLTFCGIGDFATPEEAIMSLNLDGIRTFVHDMSHPTSMAAEMGLISSEDTVNADAPPAPQIIAAAGLVVGMFAGLFAGYKSGTRRHYVPI